MGSRLRRSWTGYCLLLLLAAGFVLRLVYALPDLDASRFWDERVSFWNVRGLVAEGRIRPHNGFYPSLSYLPHSALIAAAEGLHRVTGIEALSMLDPEGTFGLSAGAVLAVRLVSVIAGTLTLGLVFLLGRRLFSPEVGLLAAGLMSVSWTHLFVSVKFKPDVLAVLLTTVAFWWILDAMERPESARFARAGAGVGLAASTKLLGASTAIPLSVTVLLTAGRRVRTWVRLALAGVLAVLTFVLLNPWLSVIVRDMSRTKADYAAKAAAAGATHWTVLAEEARYLVQDHRPVIAFFVAVGLLGLAARAMGWLPGRPERVAALAVLSAILGHSVFYALATRHFRSWNYLPVVPFTSLVAAWAMVGAAEWGLGRLPEKARGPTRAALWAAALVALLAFPASLTYIALVPSTWEVVSRSLSGHEAAPAVIVYGENVRDAIERETDRPKFVFVEVDALEEVPQANLDRAAAVVFPESRLGEPGRSFHAQWLASKDRSVTLAEPRWFRARGPTLVLVRNPWELLDRTRRAVDGETGRFRLALPEPLRPDQTISLTLRLRRGRRGQLPGAVSVRGAGEVPLYPFGGRRAPLMISPKFRVERQLEAMELDFRRSPEGAEPFELSLYRWKWNAGADAQEAVPDGH